MLTKKRMSALEAFEASKLISIVNPLMPDTVLDIMRYYQEKHDFFYSDVDFCIFLRGKDLDNILKNPLFLNYFDPATKEDIENSNYLGCLGFELNFNDSLVHCHVYLNNNLINPEIKIRLNKGITFKVMSDLSPEIIVDINNRLYKETQNFPLHPGD